MYSARHFRWEALPPLQHHNKDLAVTVHVVTPTEPAEDATLKVTLKNGTTETLRMSRKPSRAMRARVCVLLCACCCVRVVVSVDVTHTCVCSLHTAIKSMRDAAILDKLYAIDGSTDVERDSFRSEETALMLQQ